MQPGRILITGATGRIGRVLMHGLATDFTLSPVAKEHGHDLHQRDGLVELFAGHDAVIHLAWTYADDGDSADAKLNPNIAMTRNVLAVCKDAGVNHVVVASSVHAYDFYDFKDGDTLIPATTSTRPNGAYGTAKLKVEQISQSYAAEQAMAVTAVRFGRVDPEVLPERGDQWEQRVFLSPSDCVSLLRCILTSPAMPGVYSVVNAVSNNAGRIHDVSNPFGWSPADAVENYLSADDD